MAGSWLGYEVDAVDGTHVGRVHGIFADVAAGEPAWLIVELRRRRLPLLRRPVRLVAVPLRDCAGAAGRVWTAHRAEALRGAPTVDPTRPLLGEHDHEHRRRDQRRQQEEADDVDDPPPQRYPHPRALRFSPSQKDLSRARRAIPIYRPGQ